MKSGKQLGGRECCVGDKMAEPRLNAAQEFPLTRVRAGGGGDAGSRSLVLKKE